MNKKCYILMLSKQFPVYHPKAGQLTGFEQKIKNQDKIHTIRENYNLWKKRIDEINAGRAYLSVREWSGKPYEKGGNQVELMQFHKLGVEKIEFKNEGWFINGKRDIHFYPDRLAENDGLSLRDFCDWFFGHDKNNTHNNLNAIIHFTDFRYESQSKYIICSDCEHKHLNSERVKRHKGPWQTNHCPKCFSESIYRHN